MVSWFPKNSSNRDQTITREAEQQIVAYFNKWSPRILAIPEVQTVVTFDQVMTFFETDRPADFTVYKGVIIRQEHVEGQLLGQVFLDQHNRIVCRKDGTPYGRQLVTKSLDKKMIDYFKDQGLSVFKLTDRNLPGDGFHQDVFVQFGELLRDLMKLPQVIPVITYEETIKYFVSTRPNDPRIKKGAILRKYHIQGHQISQMFLDKNNELVCDPTGKPYGRQLVAVKLDEELLDTFGNKNVIIVE
ncbi:hypothetical protein MC7420_3499 [Coleofasciculus chthonoplastes PCC 7420]|uniref:Uncharacterized protein n=1 Tax=Coleofasciculus chthonoplastes PCC 7420 TaxID=118168 RepID=B4W036_9CYAN|nr:hypothetical protein [Coleofasciculus chthonoplastes]EDX72427.1 hypothetical protein MC7420_3499 [Coleofasciculus chthonoplastes PCC 7420]